MDEHDFTIPFRLRRQEINCSFGSQIHAQEVTAVSVTFSLVKVVLQRRRCQFAIEALWSSVRDTVRIDFQREHSLFGDLNDIG